MNIFHNIEALQNFVRVEKLVGKSVGFVPTMGALHAGHISLVEQAKEDCDVCVVSIFVNPTQFNDAKDLATYPRTLEADCHLLEVAGATAVFAPEVEVMYPQNQQVRNDYEVGRVAEVMEGAHRPGHFQGVMQVVQRLFEIVEPDKAFFGEKDFQQVAVIRAMCRLVNSPVEIIACPIVREADGLALSSRNVRLSERERSFAPNIYRVLSESLEYAKAHTPSETELWVIEQINGIETLRVEYYEIVDSLSLERISDWNDSPAPQGCITVFCGEVRLIDNISYTDAKS